MTSNLDTIGERIRMGGFDQYPIDYDPTDPNVEKIIATQQLQILNESDGFFNINYGQDNSIKNFGPDPKMCVIGTVPKNLLFLK